MPFFPETIRNSLAGRTVKMSYLVYLDFETTPMRVWTGLGDLSAASQTWSGLGELGQITGLEQAVNGQAPETTLVLSGIDQTIVRTARDEFPQEAKGRSVNVLLQFHNDADDQPLTLFDDPYPIWSGRMRTARFEMQSTGLRRITIGCESLFALRGRPNFSMYTDQDQQKRFPGDKGFDFVNSLINKVVKWPDF